MHGSNESTAIKRMDQQLVRRHERGREIVYVHTHRAMLLYFAQTWIAYLEEKNSQAAQSVFRSWRHAQAELKILMGVPR